MTQRHGTARSMMMAVLLASSGAGCRTPLGQAGPAAGGVVTRPALPAAAVAPAAVRRIAGYAAIATVARVRVYRSPSGTAAGTLGRPLLTGGPLVFLVAERAPARAPQWHRVYLPVRPNGSTGWIRAGDVRLAALGYRLDLHRSRHLLRVYRSGVAVRSLPVGLGRSGTPTPGGTFYLTERIRLRNPAGPYGPWAFGLSAFSPTLFSFAGGNGVIGLHGTNATWSVGRSVSHGCIRLRNADITALARLLPLGTPVRVLA